VVIIGNVFLTEPIEIYRFMSTHTRVNGTHAVQYTVQHNTHLYICNVQPCVLRSLNRYAVSTYCHRTGKA